MIENENNHEKEQIWKKKMKKKNQIKGIYHYQINFEAEEKKIENKEIKEKIINRK